MVEQLCSGLKDFIKDHMQINPWVLNLQSFGKKVLLNMTSLKVLESLYVTKHLDKTLLKMHLKLKLEKFKFSLINLQALGMKTLKVTQFGESQLSG